MALPCSWGVEGWEANNRRGQILLLSPLQVRVRRADYNIGGLGAAVPAGSLKAGIV